MRYPNTGAGDNNIDRIWPSMTSAEKKRNELGSGGHSGRSLNSARNQPSLAIDSWNSCERHQCMFARRWSFGNPTELLLEPVHLKQHSREILLPAPIQLQYSKQYSNQSNRAFLQPARSKQSNRAFLQPVRAKQSNRAIL